MSSNPSNHMTGWLTAIRNEKQIKNLWAGANRGRASGRKGRGKKDQSLHFIACCYDNLPSKSTLREKGLIPLIVQILVRHCGEVMVQESEAACHVAATVKSGE